MDLDFGDSCSGFVLVGGQSSRMGVDKALLPHRGRTLADWVASCVAEATGSVTLIGPVAAYAHLGHPVIEDPHTGSGPLSGIAAALTHAAPHPCLVVACDIPLMYPAFLKELLQFAKSSSKAADLVMPRGPSGYDQPLCAVYRTSCLAPALAALREGRFKVRTAFSDLHIAYWAVDDERERVLSNANTPEEWDRLQRIDPLK